MLDIDVENAITQARKIHEFKSEIASAIGHFGNAIYHQEDKKKRLQKDIDRFMETAHIFFSHNFTLTSMSTCTLSIATGLKEREGKISRTLEVDVNWPSGARSLTECLLSIDLYNKVAQLALLIQAKVDEFG